MTPLASVLAWLPLLLLVFPAVLGLIVLRAFFQWRADRDDEQFRAHVRSVDVTDWRSKRAA